MDDRYSIQLRVVDKRTGEQWVMATDGQEFPIFSERFVDEVRAPVDVGFAVHSLDTVVSALKKREFRRELLLSAARSLAGRLGDFIEDSEGWHGERRRDRIKEMKGKTHG